jgi:hypothetical protein
VSQQAPGVLFLKATLMRKRTERTLRRICCGGADSKSIRTRGTGTVSARAVA